MNRVRLLARPSARSASASVRPTHEVRLRPRERLDGGPRAVGGQLERGGRAAELLAPVGELRARAASLEQLALPGREVGVLQAGLGQRRGARPAGTRRRARVSSRIRMPSDQPSATMWCMVTRRRCSCAPRPQEACTEEGAPARDRRGAALPRRRRLAPRPRFRSAESRDRSVTVERSGLRRRTRSAGTGDPSTVPIASRRPSWRAPDLGEAPLRAAQVEPPAQAEGAGDVVGGAALVELVEEPEPFLREGEGARPSPRGPRTRGRPPWSARVPAARAERTCGQPRRPWAPRTAAARARSTPSASRTRRGARVAASEWPPELEEVVVDAHLVAGRARRARWRPRTSSIGVRGAVAAAASASGARGSGSAATVDLAVRCRGNAASRTSMRRDHVLGKARRAAHPAGPLPRRSSPSATRYATNDGRRSVAPRATTTASRTAVLLAQQRPRSLPARCGAPQLDLVIGAAEALDRDRRRRKRARSPVR